jgi:hypothetical protein
MLDQEVYGFGTMEIIARPFVAFALQVIKQGLLKTINCVNNISWMSWIVSGFVLCFTCY